MVVSLDCHAVASQYRNGVLEDHNEPAESWSAHSKHSAEPAWRLADPLQCHDEPSWSQNASLDYHDEAAWCQIGWSDYYNEASQFRNELLEHYNEPACYFAEPAEYSNEPAWFGVGRHDATPSQRSAATRLWTITLRRPGTVVEPVEHYDEPPGYFVEPAERCGPRSYSPRDERWRVNQSRKRSETGRAKRGRISSSVKTCSSPKRRTSVSER